MIEDIVKSDLKTILHSTRANLYYLEKCRIMQKDGRIVYLTETKKENSEAKEESSLDSDEKQDNEDSVPGALPESSAVNSASAEKENTDNEDEQRN